MPERVTLSGIEATPREAKSLADFLQRHLPDIQTLLSNHWYGKKGTISEVEILSSSVRFTSDDGGVFNVRYRVTFSFACADVSADQWEQMTISFKIVNSTIELVSEEEPERFDEL